MYMLIWKIRWKEVKLLKLEIRRVDKDVFRFEFRLESRIFNVFLVINIEVGFVVEGRIRGRLIFWVG